MSNYKKTFYEVVEKDGKKFEIVTSKSPFSVVAMSLLNVIIPNIGVIVGGSELVDKIEMKRFNEVKLKKLHDLSLKKLLDNGYTII